MVRRVVNVPDNFATLLSCDWDIDWRSKSPSENSDGTSQTTLSDFPRWIGSPKIHLTREEIPRWRAIKLYAQGRVGLYKMRMIDPLGFPELQKYPVGIPFKSSALFSNGLGFRYRPMVTANASYSAGAETIDVDISLSGIAPFEGQLMSYSDWPFAVTWVRRLSELVYRIGVQMPLRVSIPQGAHIDHIASGIFEATEDTMGRTDYGNSYNTTVRLSFREVLRR